MKQILIAALLLSFLSACNNDKPAPPPDENTTTPAVAVPIINYSVVKYHDHDPNLFTEGFLFHDGQLYESTGSPEEMPNIKSMIVIDDLAKGTFQKKAEIDGKKYFGEGIVFFKDKVYELTYKNQIGFIYDAATFKQTGQFSYTNTEGWSLTTDGTNIIMDDGTANLTYLDPSTMKPVKTLAVTEDDAPCTNLNELEYIKGFIYANIWMTNYIVKIDPATGKVVGKLNLSSLTDEAKVRNPQADVLNGIAYDPATDKIYVTGKLWKNIYEISFPH